MKRLIFSILFLTSYVHAADPRETVTPGVGLLIPTTGYLDVNRRIDDKYNGNFKIIAATITSNISQINALNSSTGNFANKTDVIASTQSIRTDIGKLQVTDSTTSQRIDGLQTSLSTSDVQQAKYANYWATATQRIDQGQIFQSTVSAYLSGGALAVYDEGSVIGNATTLNCVGSGVTCTQSGTTTTVTIAGGGGSSVSNSTSPVFFPGIPGPVSLSTSIPANNNSVSFGPSTFTARDFWCKVSVVSTVTTTAFAIYQSTALYGAQVWTRLTPDLHITTNTNLSSLTTSYTLNPNVSYGIFNATTTDPRKGDAAQCAVCWGNAWIQ